MLETRLLGPGSVAPESIVSPVGTRLNPSVGIDFSASPQTLIMVLSQDCQFCVESMPFYERLTNQDRTGTQMIVAALPTEPSLGQYLASRGVIPDAVVFVEPGQLPVLGTPTLLVADQSGVVTHSWIGMRRTGVEERVLQVVFASDPA